MFIGRTRELEGLEEQYNSKNGQLVILYGRRRIGKTEILKQFCKDKEHVFFSCKECTDKSQLKAFSKSILKENIPASQYISEFQDWEQALGSIKDIPYKKGKKLVIIDEFPYMCKGNTSIPSVLQNLWDHILQDSDVMLVLCGSSISFMEEELLGAKNPLYGRATWSYKVKQLSFEDASKFFPNYSPSEKVIAYSILGGIPHYLKQFDPDKSLENNIKKHILTKGSPLYSETEFLLKQELRETQVYNTLIETIALGSTSLNEITKKALMESTSKTAIYLKKLLEIQLIDKIFSVDASIKEQGNANRGYYELSDNFFRFWYTFVYSNYSELELGDVDGVYETYVAPFLHEFAAKAFEKVCTEYVYKLRQANCFPVRFAHIGKWMGKTTVLQRDKTTSIKETEIDVTGISKDNKHWLIGECKFRKTLFSYEDYMKTVVKLSEKKKGATFYYALFSESGFDSRIIEETKKNPNLYLYPLEDIVNLKICQKNLVHLDDSPENELVGIEL